MLNISFLKNRYLFLSENSDSSSIHQIKRHFQHLQSKTPAHDDIDQLNFLMNAYIFRQFNTACNITQLQCSALQDFKSPSYRSLLIKQLPSNLNRLLHFDELSVDNKTLEKVLCLSPSVQEQTVNIANRSPFVSNNQYFRHFDDIKNQLEQQDLLAVTCAAILKQHCMSEKSSATEQDFFHQGLCCGYISMQLARENRYSPLKSFITNIIHCICRLYIYRELENKKRFSSKHDLLLEINDLSPKLSYWVAKDWGLPDEILYTLKERFLQPHDLSITGQIMQKSEHANLALMLYQHEQFSRKQAQKFISSMNIDYQHLFEQLTTTTH